MANYNLKPGIYAVGVLNPNLRIFDIIMRAQYGTSYNAYIVQGSEKTALIETVHGRFFDEYIKNIQMVTDISKIDYVVLNHTEPDHSGSLRKLIELGPNIQVVASMAGAKYLGAITNLELNTKIVKDGDTIDLGGKTLTFTPAPFLHWPDSMFTYIPQDKVLFSCDMFGTHYCEPRILDKYISYPHEYDDALKYYFDCIFGPFKPHVVSGMNKVANLETDIICPSHGPVLTEHSIKAVWDKYAAWSASSDKSGKKTVGIIYVSAYGCTGTLAQKAYDIATESGFDAQIFDVSYSDFEEVAALANTCDVLMFGSPTINRDALKPIWDVISSIDAVGCAGKHAAVFGSYGWSGEAVLMLTQRLSALKMKPFGDGFRVNFVPSDTEINAFETFAKDFLANTV